MYDTYTELLKKFKQQEEDLGVDIHDIANTYLPINPQENQKLYRKAVNSERLRVESQRSVRKAKVVTSQIKDPTMVLTAVLENKAFINKPMISKSYHLGGSMERWEEAKLLQVRNTIFKDKGISLETPSVDLFKYTYSNFKKASINSSWKGLNTSKVINPGKKYGLPIDIPEKGFLLDIISKVTSKKKKMPLQYRSLLEKDLKYKIVAKEYKRLYLHRYLSQKDQYSRRLQRSLLDQGNYVKNSWADRLERTFLIHASIRYFDTLYPAALPKKSIGFGKLQKLSGFTSGDSSLIHPSAINKELSRKNLNNLKADSSVKVRPAFFSQALPQANKIQHQQSLQHNIINYNKLLGISNNSFFKSKRDLHKKWDMESILMPNSNILPNQNTTNSGVSSLGAHNGFGLFKIKEADFEREKLYSADYDIYHAASDFERLMINIEGALDTLKEDGRVGQYNRICRNNDLYLETRPWAGKDSIYALSQDIPRNMAMYTYPKHAITYDYLDESNEMSYYKSAFNINNSFGSHIKLDNIEGINSGIPEFYNKLDSFNITESTVWGNDLSYLASSDLLQRTVNPALTESISASNYPWSGPYMKAELTDIRPPVNIKSLIEFDISSQKKLYPRYMMYSSLDRISKLAKQREFGFIPIIAETFNPTYYAGNILTEPDHNPAFRGNYLTHYDSQETFNLEVAPRWYPSINKEKMGTTQKFWDGRSEIVKKPVRFLILDSNRLLIRNFLNIGVRGLSTFELNRPWLPTTIKKKKTYKEVKTMAKEISMIAALVPNVGISKHKWREIKADMYKLKLNEYTKGEFTNAVMDTVQNRKNRINYPFSKRFLAPWYWKKQRYGVYPSNQRGRITREDYLYPIVTNGSIHGVGNTLHSKMIAGSNVLRLNMQESLDQDNNILLSFNDRVGYRSLKTWQEMYVNDDELYKILNITHRDTEDFFYKEKLKHHMKPEEVNKNTYGDKVESRKLLRGLLSPFIGMSKSDITLKKKKNNPLNVFIDSITKIDVKDASGMWWRKQVQPYYFLGNRGQPKYEPDASTTLHISEGPSKGLTVPIEMAEQVNIKPQNLIGSKIRNRSNRYFNRMANIDFEYYGIITFDDFFSAYDKTWYSDERTNLVNYYKPTKSAFGKPNCENSYVFTKGLTRNLNLNTNSLYTNNKIPYRQLMSSENLTNKDYLEKQANIIQNIWDRDWKGNNFDTVSEYVSWTKDKLNIAPGVLESNYYKQLILGTYGKETNLYDKTLWRSVNLKTLGKIKTPYNPTTRQELLNTYWNMYKYNTEAEEVVKLQMEWEKKSLLYNIKSPRIELPVTKSGARIARESVIQEDLVNAEYLLNPFEYDNAVWLLPTKPENLKYTLISFSEDIFKWVKPKTLKDSNNREPYKKHKWHSIIRPSNAQTLRLNYDITEAMTINDSDFSSLDEDTDDSEFNDHLLALLESPVKNTTKEEEIDLSDTEISPLVRLKAALKTSAAEPILKSSNIDIKLSPGGQNTPIEEDLNLDSVSPKTEEDSQTSTMPAMDALKKMLNTPLVKKLFAAEENNPLKSSIESVLGGPIKPQTSASKVGEKVRTYQRDIISPTDTKHSLKLQNKQGISVSTLQSSVQVPQVSTTRKEFSTIVSEEEYDLAEVLTKSYKDIGIFPSDAAITENVLEDMEYVSLDDVDLEMRVKTSLDRLQVSERTQRFIQAINIMKDLEKGIHNIKPEELLVARYTFEYIAGWIQMPFYNDIKRSLEAAGLTKAELGWVKARIRNNNAFMGDRVFKRTLNFSTALNSTFDNHIVPVGDSRTTIFKDVMKQIFTLYKEVDIWQKKIQDAADHKERSITEDIKTKHFDFVKKGLEKERKKNPNHSLFLKEWKPVELAKVQNMLMFLDWRTIFTLDKKNLEHAELVMTAHYMPKKHIDVSSEITLAELLMYKKILEGMQYWYENNYKPGIDLIKTHFKNWNLLVVRSKLALVKNIWNFCWESKVSPEAYFFQTVMNDLQRVEKDVQILPITPEDQRRVESLSQDDIFLPQLTSLDPEDILTYILNFIQCDINDPQFKRVTTHTLYFQRIEALKNLMWFIKGEEELENPACRDAMILILEMLDIDVTEEEINNQELLSRKFEYRLVRRLAFLIEELRSYTNYLTYNVHLTTKHVTNPVNKDLKLYENMGWKQTKEFAAIKNIARVIRHETEERITQRQNAVLAEVRSLLHKSLESSIGKLDLPNPIKAPLKIRWDSRINKMGWKHNEIYKAISKEFSAVKNMDSRALIYIAETDNPLLTKLKVVKQTYMDTFTTTLDDLFDVYKDEINIEPSQEEILSVFQKVKSKSISKEDFVRNVEEYKTRNLKELKDFYDQLMVEKESISKKKWEELNKEADRMFGYERILDIIGDRELEPVYKIKTRKIKKEVNELFFGNPLEYVDRLMAYKPLTETRVQHFLFNLEEMYREYLALLQMDQFVGTIRKSLTNRYLHCTQMHPKLLKARHTVFGKLYSICLKNRIQPIEFFSRMFNNDIKLSGLDSEAYLASLPRTDDELIANLYKKTIAYKKVFQNMTWTPETLKEHINKLDTKKFTFPPEAKPIVTAEKLYCGIEFYESIMAHLENLIREDFEAFWSEYEWLVRGFIQAWLPKEDFEMIKDHPKYLTATFRTFLSQRRNHFLGRVNMLLNYYSLIITRRSKCEESREIFIKSTWQDFDNRIEEQINQRLAEKQSFIENGLAEYEKAYNAQLKASEAPKLEYLKESLLKEFHAKSVVNDLLLRWEEMCNVPKDKLDKAVHEVCKEYIYVRKTKPSYITQFMSSLASKDWLVQHSYNTNAKKDLKDVHFRRVLDFSQVDSYPEMGDWSDTEVLEHKHTKDNSKSLQSLNKYINPLLNRNIKVDHKFVKMIKKLDNFRGNRVHVKRLLNSVNSSKALLKNSQYKYGLITNISKNNLFGSENIDSGAWNYSFWEAFQRNYMDAVVYGNYKNLEIVPREFVSYQQDIAANPYRKPKPYSLFGKYKNYQFYSMNSQRFEGHFSGFSDEFKTLKDEIMEIAKVSPVKYNQGMFQNEQLNIDSLTKKRVKRDYYTTYQSKNNKTNYFIDNTKGIVNPAMRYKNQRYKILVGKWLKVNKKNIKNKHRHFIKSYKNTRYSLDDFTYNIFAHKKVKHQRKKKKRIKKNKKGKRFTQTNFWNKNIYIHKKKNISTDIKYKRPEKSINPYSYSIKSLPFLVNRNDSYNMDTSQVRNKRYNNYIADTKSAIRNNRRHVRRYKHRKRRLKHIKVKSTFKIKKAQKYYKRAYSRLYGGPHPRRYFPNKHKILPRVRPNNKELGQYLYSKHLIKKMKNQKKRYYKVYYQKRGNMYAPKKYRVKNTRIRRFCYTFTKERKINSIKNLIWKERKRKYHKKGLYKGKKRQLSNSTPRFLSRAFVKRIQELGEKDAIYYSKKKKKIGNLR